MIRLTSEDEAKKCDKTYAGHYPRVDGSAAFPIPGAGTLVIGQHWTHTGGATGLGFAVSWAKHGYAGGVIDRKELIALRDYINAYLENTHTVEFTEADEPEVVTS